MVDNNKNLITIGIIVFGVILAIAVVAGVALSNISSQANEPEIYNQAEADLEKNQVEKEEDEKEEAEKIAAEKAAAEKAAAEKAAAEKAAAEKAAAEKAAAEKAEKERLENLPAVLVNSYYNYAIDFARYDLNFTFEQTQNVKHIDVYLLNFAGDEISAENSKGVSSNKFRIFPTGVNAQISVYNVSDSIESVKLIVTYNNGRTDTYYDGSFALG